MNATPLNLLLSDDDIDDCTFFKEALEELPVSATLTTVNDGVQLMQLLLNPEQPLPHALYLDINMPRKNGIECLSEIKQHEKLKELPVIIFSTSLNSNVVDLLYDGGATYYICKPAEFAELKNVIFTSIGLITKSIKLVPKEKFVLAPGWFLK